ncbi:MAG: hypothetical protein VX827_04145, partial [Pseudomonadota bacterium]|nr:hypothetical protein [Pseudomonadota bacterium]
NAIAVIEKPLAYSTPLLFGSFVQADIEGRALDNVWKLPASAISQKQEVWLVMPSTGQLAKFTPSVLFESEGYAYITHQKPVKLRAILRVMLRVKPRVTLAATACQNRLAKYAKRWWLRAL